jgi:ribokinase
MDMRVINFGSVNIDHVYEVAHFVRPGETLRSDSYRTFSGGKGANQSLSLARAGAKVLHAGKIGADGQWLNEKLHESGVDISLVKITDTPTGHALIQVNMQGENAIIIHGGANETVTDDDIKRVLAIAERGDCLLVQNEINNVAKIIQKAKEKGLLVVFNPAPMNETVKDYPLDLVDIFIINEVEGEALTQQNDPETIVAYMQRLYPQSKTVLTLGTEGLIYGDDNVTLSVPALKVEAVDTTGAGDTFIGYFLAELISGGQIEECLQMGLKASALCVTRKGAGDSIPLRNEVEGFKG